jgi:AcrR family transcriptional regulator
MSRPKTRRAPAVDMLTKTRPLQDRSRQTYEAILDSTAQLLEEIGIERLSTNLICERAQLTPPALYRYFPNKYALLRELGIRLMQAQDEAVFAWIDAGGLRAATQQEAFEKNQEIHQRVIDITRRQPGALWILRALRAVPAMWEVRITSRANVAERLFQAMRAQYPNTSEPDLRRAVRLNLELASAATEMVLEEPENEAEEITSELSWMMVTYYSRFS